MKLLHRLRKAAALSSFERRIIWQCWMVGLTVRALLYQNKIEQLQARMVRFEPSPARALPLEKLIPFVHYGCARVPKSTCLVRALTAQTMCARLGIDSVLVIGVAKDAQDQFEAHAWLEINDEVLVGGDVSRYQRLMAMPARVAGASSVETKVSTT